MKNNLKFNCFIIFIAKCSNDVFIWIYNTVNHRFGLFYGFKNTYYLWFYYFYVKFIYELFMK
jgi:hypothetical protein